MDRIPNDFIIGQELSFFHIFGVIKFVERDADVYAKSLEVHVASQSNDDSVGSTCSVIRVARHVIAWYFTVTKNNLEHRMCVIVDKTKQIDANQAGLSCVICEAGAEMTKWFKTWFEYNQALEIMPYNFTGDQVKSLFNMYIQHCEVYDILMLEFAAPAEYRPNLRKFTTKVQLGDVKQMGLIQAKNPENSWPQNRVFYGALCEHLEKVSGILFREFELRSIKSDGFSISIKGKLRFVEIDPELARQMFVQICKYNT